MVLRRNLFELQALIVIGARIPLAQYEERILAISRLQPLCYRRQCDDPTLELAKVLPSVVTRFSRRIDHPAPSEAQPKQESAHHTDKEQNRFAFAPLIKVPGTRDQPR